MQNISKPTENTGGIKRFWFVPVNDVFSVGDIILNELQAFALKAGKKWIDVYTVFNDRKYEENKDGNNIGFYFDRSFTAFFPGYSLQALLQFDEMTQQRFLLAYQDNNDLFKIIGTTDNPLMFRYKLTSGKDGSSDHGVEMQFYSAASMRVIDTTNDIIKAAPIVYNDWFLPSLEELEAMYTNLHAESVGSFSSDNYWSSTEYDATRSSYFNFTTGEQGKSALKTSIYLVRACRSFTDVAGKYDLRDIGPAGGLIFYINGTTYYEAAPSDQGVGMSWSNITGNAIGTTDPYIGTGAANTAAIIAQSGGANDWFLPSKGELDAIYNNLYLQSIGNLSSGIYWSSTESSAKEYAWQQDFSSGNIYENAKSHAGARVRACRSFIDYENTYNVGDIGPSGGWIFYNDDKPGVLFETAHSDQSLGLAWSNITNVLIGTTGAYIGEGLNNSNEIIAQPGHTDSAAKLCLDYDNRYAHTNSAAKLCNDLEITN